MSSKWWISQYGKAFKNQFSRRFVPEAIVILKYIHKMSVQQQYNAVLARQYWIRSDLSVTSGTCSLEIVFQVLKKIFFLPLFFTVFQGSSLAPSKVFIPCLLRHLKNYFQWYITVNTTCQQSKMVTYITVAIISVIPPTIKSTVAEWSILLGNNMSVLPSQIAAATLTLKLFKLTC